jgi:hypothetical protein
MGRTFKDRPDFKKKIENTNPKKVKKRFIKDINKRAKNPLKTYKDKE